MTQHIFYEWIISSIWKSLGQSVNSVCLPIRPYVFLSVRLFECMTVCMSVRVCLYDFLQVASACVSLVCVCLYDCLYVCTCLSLCLFTDS